MRYLKFAAICGVSVFTIEAFYAFLDPTDDQFYKSPIFITVFAWICEHSILVLQDLVIGVRSKNILGFGLIDLGKGIARVFQLNQDSTIIFVLVAGIFAFWSLIGATTVYIIDKCVALRRLPKP